MPAEQALLFLLYRGKDLRPFCDLAERVKQHVHDKMGLFLDRVLPVRAIPKTTSGKLQRYKLGESYVRGEFEAQIREIESIRAARQQGDTTERKLSRLCRELLGREPDPHEHFTESGGNSLILTKITEELSARHGIDIPVATLYKYPTVAKLSAFLDQGAPEAIPSAALPEGYFAESGAGSAGAVSEFEADLDEKACAALRGLAEGAQTDVAHVCAALFAYLLREVSRETPIPVQIALGEDRLISVEVDFEAIDTLEQLIRLVAAAAAEDRRSYAIDSASRFERQPERGRIVPLVANRSALALHRDRSEAFDVVLEIAERADGIDLLFACDGRRLNVRKMKALFSQYLLLIGDIAELRDKVSV